MAKKRKKKDDEPVTNCDQSKELITNCDNPQFEVAKTPEDKAIALLRSQIVTAKDLSKIRTLPYAFTRNGIGMLSSVLGSDTAVAMNIRIMRAFTASQQIMETNAILFKRVFHLEQHQQETDEKINFLIAKMDDNSPKLLPEQIFGTGCIPSDQPSRWMMLGAAMAIQENGTESLDYFAMMRGWELARSDVGKT